MQTIIIAILFIAAIFYVGRLIYRNLATKKSCGSNCKCGVDFSQIETGSVKKDNKTIY